MAEEEVLMTDKSWRDAQLPKWVKDSIAADMKQMELRLALAWPTEARPEPAFIIGGYGRVTGAMEDGTFFISSRYNVAQAITLKGGKMNGKVLEYPPHSPYFRTAKEARLDALWDRCDDFARDLLPYVKAYRDAK